MKYAVGYPVHDDEDVPFVDLLDEFREQIGEVYFAWPGEASGRSPMAETESFHDDFAAIRAMGIRLDLLFNANCYGESAASSSLAARAKRIIHSAEPDVVTTTSPFIARMLKAEFPTLELRASVNMRIGTVEAMEYLADVFDSFYLQRDYNRDCGRIEELKSWCDVHGKKLLMLANSGCLRFCSTQTFHDNLVAHEAQIDQSLSVPCEVLACRDYLRRPDYWPAVFQATWVRPEDMANYEPYFPLVKLATRMHINPGLVIRAYVHRRYPGNLLDLLEPGHAFALRNHVIDNTRFPADWFARTTQCDKRCHRCSYCAQVLRDTLTKIS